MEVRVRVLDTCHRFTLHPQASVASLKGCIQRECGLPAPMQSLYLQKRYLCDRDRVSMCTAEVAVRLFTPSPFELRFTVVLTSGRSLVVRTPLMSTVNGVKEYIEKATGVPHTRQRLFLDGQELRDAQVLSEVYRPGKFICYLLLPGDFLVSVALANGQRFQVPAASSDQLMRVVNRLRCIYAVDCRDQVITCEGKEIHESATVRNLSGTLVSSATSFWVWATTLDTPRRRVYMNPSDSISSITSQFPVNLSTVPWVLFNGRLLNTTDTAAAADLPTGAILECGDLLLHIRSLNIEKLDLAVPSDSFVGTLKRELTKRLYRGAFQLVFDGAEMSDARTLSSYGMVQSATVELIEATDQHYWVESETDRTLQCVDDPPPLSLQNWAILKGILLHSSPAGGVPPGSVVHLRDASSSVLIACECCGETYYVALHSSATAADLPTLLKAVTPVKGLAGVSASQQLTTVPQHRVVVLTDDRRFVRCRYRDGVQWVEWVAGMKAGELRRQLDAAAVLVYRDRPWSDGDLMELTAANACESVHVCREDEAVLCDESTKERFIISLKNIETLSDLRQLCRTLIPETLLLFFGQRLKGDSTKVREIGIHTGSCVWAVPVNMYPAALMASPLTDKFISLRRFDGTVHLLRFWHSIAWKDLKRYLAAELQIDSFSLVLDGKMLTSHRLWHIAIGKTVEVIAHSEAVLLRFSDGAVRTVPLPEALDYDKEVADVSGACRLFMEDKLIQKSMVLQACRESNFSVVDCVPVSETLMKIARVDMECMYVSLPKATQSLADVVKKLQLLECDERLQPRFYRRAPSHQSDLPIPQHGSISLYEDILLLYPHQVRVAVVTRKLEKLLLYMTAEDTLGKVKAAVASRMCALPVSLVVLANNSWLRDDSLSLSAGDKGIDWDLLVLRKEEILVNVTLKSLTTQHIKHPCDTVSSIRHEVCKHRKISKSGSRLLFNSRVMTEEAVIGSYQQLREIDLRLLQSPETLVVVSSAAGTECSEVLKTSDISHTYIRSKFGQVVSDSQTVHWVGELQDSLSVADYNLKHDSALFVLCCPRPTVHNLTISVKLAEGTVKRKLPHPCTVAEALRLVGGTALIVDEEVAESQKLLGDYGVVSGDEVRVLMSGEYTVKVAHKDECFLLVVKGEVSLQQLKGMICKRTEIPARLQDLWAQGQLLGRDTRFLESSGTIELRINPHLVCVRTATKCTAVARPSRSLRVEEWKKNIEKVTKVPAAQQRVIVRGREMKGEETFGDVGDEVAVLGSSDIRLFVTFSLSQFPIYCSQRESISEVKKRVKRLGFRSFWLRLMADITIDSETPAAIWRGQRFVRLVASDS